MAINYYGYNPPFFGGHQNVMSRQSGDQIIVNDVLQLLLTNKGERVMRPDWGTLINASVFDPLDDQLTNQLKGDIIRQLSVNEPRVDINVSFVVNEDESILRIKLSGTFTNEPNHIFEEEIEVPIVRLET